MDLKKVKVFITTVLLCILVTIPVHAFSAGLSDDRSNELRNNINDIINSGEFNNLKKSSGVGEKLKESVEYVKNAIWDFLKKLLPDFNLGGIPGAKNNSLFSNIGNFESVFIIIVLVLVIIALAVFWFKRYLKRSKVKLEKDDEDLLVSMLKNSDKIENKALMLYNSGDYREAIRYLYLSLLLKLNENNHIRISKSKTNRQYLNELRTNNISIYDNTLEFTNAFNYYWYGQKDPLKEEFDNWYITYNKIARGEI
jgi:hypothetical protein